MRTLSKLDTMVYTIQQINTHLCGICVAQVLCYYIGVIVSPSYIGSMEQENYGTNDTVSIIYMYI